MRKAALSLWVLAVQERLLTMVLAMIVAVPLIATPFDARMRGLAALSVEGFAILLMFTLLWRARWNLGLDKIMAFVKTGANLPILLLGILVAVSCLFSPAKGYSIQEALRIGAGILLYFVIVYQFRR